MIDNVNPNRHVVALRDPILHVTIQNSILKSIHTDVLKKAS